MLSRRLVFVKQGGFLQLKKGLIKSLVEFVQIIWAV